MIKSQQDIEHRHRIGQSCLNIVGNTVKNLFYVTDNCQHGESRLNNHPFVPRTFFTQLDIGWDALFAAKAQIRQSDGLTIQFLDFIVEILVVGIHGQPFLFPRGILHF